MTLYETAVEAVKDERTFARWLCELLELGEKDNCEICPAKKLCGFNDNGFRNLLAKDATFLWEDGI